MNCQGPDSGLRTGASAVARAHSRRPCPSRPQTKNAIVALPDAPGTAVGSAAPGTDRASASKVAPRTLKRTSSISEKWSRNAAKAARNSARGIARLAASVPAGGAQPWSEIHLTWGAGSPGRDGNGGASTASAKYDPTLARSRSRTATDRSRTSLASDSERSSIVSSRAVSLSGATGAWAGGSARAVSPAAGAPRASRAATATARQARIER